MKGLFTGLGTAVVTPFLKGKVDFGAFAALIRRQMKAGADALVVAATTGEGPTLSEEEKEEVIISAKEISKGKIPVIAGAGSNDTRTAVSCARNMEKAGADALLCVTPYYNLCSQEGLRAHFTAIADNVGIPVILYNVPFRTGVSIEAETACELFKHPRIRAIKEAASDFSKAAKMLFSAQGAYVYSGNDNMLLSEMALGASGGISVVSNIAPGIARKLTSLALKNDFAGALACHNELMPLLEIMKGGVNPVPVKAVLSVMGYIENETRLPLTPFGREELKKIEAFLNRSAKYV